MTITTDIQPGDIRPGDRVRLNPAASQRMMPALQRAAINGELTVTGVAERSSVTPGEVFAISGLDPTPGYGMEWFAHVEDSTPAVRAELRAARAEVEDLARILDTSRKATRGVLDERDSLRTVATNLEKVLDYAVSLLDERQAGQVEGYRAGIQS